MLGECLDLPCSSSKSFVIHFIGLDRSRDRQQGNVLVAHFFCSEFVIEAFIYGGYIDKNYMNFSRYSPTALAEECFFELVGYLGNSYLAKHICTRDFYLTGGMSRM